MKTKLKLLTLAALLGASSIGLCQPMITVQPQSQTNVAGTTVLFSVAATGTEPLSYDWQFNSQDLSDATGTSLVLTNVQPANAGNYTVLITNAQGSVTSVVATLTVLVPPQINSISLSGQPNNSNDLIHDYATFSASPGANVYFRASASGTSPLEYQWRFNQIDMPGKHSTELALPSLNLSNAADYTLVVTNLAGAATSHVASLTIDPTFTKITTGLLITDAGHSAGGIWGDYNNDGFLDLFVFNGMDGVPYDAYLYLNNGDGTFKKVTTGPLVNTPAESYGGCWGDYDNDGNLDLLVSTSTRRGLLYHNNGDGTFNTSTNIPVPSNLRTLNSWVDYDNDGFLDIFLSEFATTTTNLHNFLYRNNGDGTFSTVTNSLTKEGGLFFSGGAWADYDNDGNIDVFVLDLPHNRLYRNNGDGTFTRITTNSVVTDPAYSWSGAWGDYDNDGYLDLFLANADQPNFLYHNNGDGTFTRITNGVIVNDVVIPGTDGSLGCAWGDYDNDGFLDLFVTNEGDDPKVVNFLYHNNGDGTFSKVTTGSLVNEYSDSWGCAWGDYDNDGFLDLFASRGDGRGNYLYHNNGNSNAWLTVKLIGTASNRSAIGAKVRAKATYRGASRWQLRQIVGGNTPFSCNNDLQANFGLGDATNIDVVRIEWPSGIVQTLTNVAPRQALTVFEHQAGAAGPIHFAEARQLTNEGVKLSVTGNPALLYVLEASSDLLSWSKVSVRTNVTGTVEFSDSTAAKFNRRFYRVSAP